ncbi:glycosyltransferase family 4 protein [Acidimicrobiales bacterium]|jgi:phosphatidylinositol alpha-1,6-mannosyltransferase|nr:glycosyltransferase family 4 protein [Acidimicrobiales bacterium]
MARHLLVTNDFPPKIGGIQNYLWELWRRLPADDVVVHTTPCDGSDEWDATQAFTIVRSREPWLLPQPVLIRRINKLARKYEAEVVIIDPAVPAGLIGPHLDLPYGVVLHGAEVTIPGRVPVTRQLLNRVLRGAVGVIAAGGYPAAEGERSLGQRLPTTIIPPGVDTGRFRPIEPEARRAVRTRLGLDTDAPLVLSVSRLVPRKGMDTLIRASVEVQRRQPDVQFAIAGTGRHEPDLRKLIDNLDAPVTLLGRVSDDDIPDLYASADIFSMLCRSRWGGLEQEGFGIVFVESAACGVAQVAGRSGGAHEAVAHNETGLIVDDPEDHHAAAQAIADLLADPDRRDAMGEAARRRAEVEFSYDVLARRLKGAIDEMINQ